MPDRGAARRAVALVVLCAALVGCSAPAAAPAGPPSGSATARAATQKKPGPATLDVPAIGVHATGLVALGLDRAGAMEVPDDAVTTGWFRLSPVPGEPGPAVIAAHVNYDRVPGVFARLHETAVGDTATVTRADGTTVAFRVYRVAHFAKNAFPTREVYGNTAGPELRLVTCGGEFDRAAGSYRDNVVVFAKAA